jgi:Zn-dependent oligopeptidase
MPRKNSAQLKDGPVTLSKDAEKHLALLAQCPRHPATEEHYQHALSASRAVEEQWVRVNAIQVESSSDPNWNAFQESMKKLGRLQADELTAYNIWRRYEELAKEADARDADPTQTNVEREDAKTLIAEALAESGAELQWDFKNGTGLLADTLSKTIFGFLVRDEAQEAPLCESCKAE